MTDSYSGGKWAQFFAYIFPASCVVLRVPDVASNNPTGECTGGVNADVYAVRAEIFWTPKDNSTQFRILWKKNEIGRCEIATGRCEIRVPATG